MILVFFPQGGAKKEISRCFCNDALPRVLGCPTLHIQNPVTNTGARLKVNGCIEINYDGRPVSFLRERLADSQVDDVFHTGRFARRGRVGGPGPFTARRPAVNEGGTCDKKRWCGVDVDDLETKFEVLPFDVNDGGAADALDPFRARGRGRKLVKEVLGQDARDSGAEVVGEGLEVLISVLVGGADGREGRGGREDDVEESGGNGEEERSATNGEGDIREESEFGVEVGGLEHVADERLGGRRLVRATPRGVGVALGWRVEDEPGRHSGLLQRLDKSADVFGASVDVANMHQTCDDGSQESRRLLAAVPGDMRRHGSSPHKFVVPVSIAEKDVQRE